jgi:hypothetical protein
LVHGDPRRAQRPDIRVKAGGSVEFNSVPAALNYSEYPVALFKNGREFATPNICAWQQTDTAIWGIADPKSRLVSNFC